MLVLGWTSTVDTSIPGLGVLAPRTLVLPKCSEIRRRGLLFRFVPGNARACSRLLRSALSEASGAVAAGGP